VTVMLDGRVRHADSVGNKGVIQAGDVQWMTAGSGIIHSEMPEHAEGRLRGFQLWVNLPGKLKMSLPRYQDVPAAKIGTVTRGGASARVIAGEAFGLKGAAQTLIPLRVLDVTIDKNAAFEIGVPEAHNSFIYVYDGAVTGVDARGGTLEIHRGTLAVLEGSEQVKLDAGTAGARLLMADGLPIREPVARYGPFVMNTREEIMQAFNDYQNGSLVRKTSSPSSI
jgi:quercetin 2,3-dioxygenase